MECEIIEISEWIVLGATAGLLVAACAVFHVAQLQLRRAQVLLKKQEELYWHCSFCGNPEPAQFSYELGDMEPCAVCSEGVARVMTREDALLSEIQRLKTGPESAYRDDHDD